MPTLLAWVFGIIIRKDFFDSLLYFLHGFTRECALVAVVAFPHKKIRTVDTCIAHHLNFVDHLGYKGTVAFTFHIICLDG